MAPITRRVRALNTMSGYQGHQDQEVTLLRIPRTGSGSHLATGSLELMTVITLLTSSSTLVTLSSCFSLSLRLTVNQEFQDNFKWFQKPICLSCGLSPHLTDPENTHLEEVWPLSEELGKFQHTRVDQDWEWVFLKQPEQKAMKKGQN